MHTYNKKNPGTPWMHLFALLIRKSMPQSPTGMSTPPKLLIASTIMVHPLFLRTTQNHIAPFTNA